MRILTNLESTLEKREHQDIINILKSIKVAMVSDTSVKNSSRNTYVNYLMKPNKIIEELSDGNLQNLILRNYCYDQTQEYLNLYKEDIVFSKKQNHLNNAASNGKLFAGLNNLKFIPRFFGMYSTKTVDKKYDDLPILPPERIGIYFRPEAYPIQSETLIRYVKGLTLNDTEVYILGANPNIQSENFTYTHTTDSNEFYGSIDKLYTTVPCEPGDVLPNHLVEAILNDIEIVVINEDGIIKPSNLYKIPLTSITAGFLELNMLFDFNHQFWDKEDSKIILEFKNTIGKLKNKTKSNYTIHSLNKDLKAYREELIKFEYYNNISNILVYAPNTKLEGIKNTAEYLKMISLRYFIVDLFEYIFEHYQLFNDRQKTYLKEAIDDILPKEELGVYLDLFFAKGDRLIINKVKREILTKYLNNSPLQFLPYKIPFVETED
jgi:predicted RNA binding protein YcfA (HicA-like mRNA interferase family)